MTPPLLEFFASPARVWPCRSPFGACAQMAPVIDPMPSWNDGAAKQAIVQFVRKTTVPASPQFAPAAQRVATFDQDGTLWVEQPMYAQVAFALIA